MFSIYNKKFKDSVLIALGLVGVIWFFGSLSSIWLPSTVNLSLSTAEVRQTVEGMVEGFGYRTYGLNAYSNFVTEQDHIQKLYDLQENEKLLSAYNDKENAIVPIYYHSVRFTPSSDNSTLITADISENGELVGFNANSEYIGQQKPFNRQALQLSFNLQTARENVFADVDTVISGLVDFQHGIDNSENVRAFQEWTKKYFTGSISGVQSLSEENNVWRGVEYYLENSYWKKFEFKRDSLSFYDENNLRYVKATLTAINGEFGINPTLTVELLPAGSLKSLKADYNLASVPSHSLEGFASTTRGVLIIVIALWTIIAFFLRVKGRVIDFKPALISSLVIGFFVFVLMMLTASNRTGEPEISIGGGIFDYLLFSGIISGFSSLFVLILISTGDSISRQYSPEKLRTWDLIRQGILNTKLLGWALIRGIAIGGVLVGLLALFPALLPQVHLGGTLMVLGVKFLFPPISLLLSGFLVSTVIVVAVYLVFISQSLKISKKGWIIVLVSTVVFTFFSPTSLVDFKIFPLHFDLLYNAVFGFFLGWMYHRYDFTTVLIGFMMFMSFATAGSGWAVENSQDFPVFLVLVGVSLVLAIVGAVFIYTGNTKEKLPEYIPNYLIEQAKEQRIKQELDIARSVQRKFLPNTTPIVTGFDTAAYCDPAHDTGGDYYDIICLDDNSAAVAIGDVSGKGIRAAFYMTFTKGVIHSLCTILKSPIELMCMANKLFRKNATKGTFISMIYGVLDNEKMTFTYVRAGHNPILYKKANGKTEWLKPKGVALGMAGEENFKNVTEEVVLKLEKGDVLVLYTDGLTEAQNKLDEFYEEERLFNVVKHEKTKSANDLRDYIVKDVRTFTGDAIQYDDMTLVVIKV